LQNLKIIVKDYTVAKLEKKIIVIPKENYRGLSRIIQSEYPKRE